MADVVLKLNEIEEIFWSITMLMLGLNPDSKDEKEISRVRTIWPTSGAPAWKIDEDICFLSITQRDDLINRQRNVRHEEIEGQLTRIMEYTRVVNCAYILYGPNSYDHAELLQHSLFLPQYKEMFNQNHLYLVPDIVAPVRAPELFSGQWWERSDFEVNFNLYVRREQAVDYIEDIAINFVSKNFSTERRIINGGIKP
ncbi:LIC_12616 family protein [uncultured Tissierella sp.]|uniref:phage neck terminator protein n=1 Tax=uncultured Tissierella sp. TaxID=448160 RepID=UPI002804E6BD|nr:hypothetical protein [uncultured Tissierella sp.]MDU5080232.1 hypothetical protein [Bacillota bacterium]